MDELIEAYNTALKNEEQKIIEIVNGSLDRAFNRLLRRTYAQLRSGQFQTAERNARVLELIPPLRPDQADEYLSAFQRLLSRSTAVGLDLAGQLSKSVKDSQVGVTVPVEAVVAAARTARGYLERHGATFSTAAAEVLSQGVAEGRPTEEMTKDLQRRLKVTKSRAEVIVRTESLRSYNEAANAYYTQNGIDLVMYYATSDDRSCPYCTAHAGNVFKRGGISVPRHPRCVLGETRVSPGTLISAQRSWYSGDIVTISTQNGNRLRCTINHPVATNRGWVFAQDLKPGDQIFNEGQRIETGLNQPDLRDKQPTIKQVWESLTASGTMAATSVPSSPIDFHNCGQFLDADIDVVDVNRPLLLYLESQGAEGICDNCLLTADVQLPFIASERTLDHALTAYGLALCSGMGASDLLPSLLRGHLTPLELLSSAASAWAIPNFSEPIGDRETANTDGLRDCINAFSGVVSTDHVVNIEVNTEAHVEVFDTTTLSGSYFANGILTHNCRCYLAPYSDNAWEVDPAYDRMRRAHRQEVLRYARNKGVDLSYGPSVFEDLAPIPTRET